MHAWTEPQDAFLGATEAAAPRQTRSSVHGATLLFWRGKSASGPCRPCGGLWCACCWPCTVPKPHPEVARLAHDGPVYDVAFSASGSRGAGPVMPRGPHRIVDIDVDTAAAAPKSRMVPGGVAAEPGASIPDASSATEFPPTRRLDFPILRDRCPSDSYLIFKC
jgi:hypothetical protein